MNLFKVKTEKNNLEIFQNMGFIRKKEIIVNTKLFSKMCKDGCVNYCKKYSCPPFAPNFKKVIKDYEGLFVVLFLCPLKEINSTEYNKVRIANVVLKSRILRLMKHLEDKFNRTFLSCGSCNLCKPCKLKSKLPCAHPDKMKYSLESSGIDCNHLSKSLFDKPLLWYKDKTSPEYTCVMCGIPCKNSEEGEIKKIVEEWLDNQ